MVTLPSQPTSSFTLKLLQPMERTLNLLTTNNEAAITDILMKLEADDESKVKFSHFIGLHGEYIVVGKYSLEPTLLTIVNNIIKVYSNFSAKSKMNPCTIETVYIMFCPFVKEMTNLRHEQFKPITFLSLSWAFVTRIKVTEGLMLKWRDAIKNVLRINFMVDFVMEHLKKISCAYISSMERQKLENVGLRISKLEAKLSAMKVEHAKISEQSKVFIDAAEEFNWNPVCFGMFKRPGPINVELELTNESD
ncbi:hypothetical protein Gotur_032812 [Gossypium turneri]